MAVFIDFEEGYEIISVALFFEFILYLAIHIEDSNPTYYSCRTLSSNNAKPLMIISIFCRWIFVAIFSLFLLFLVNDQYVYNLIISLHKKKLTATIITSWLVFLSIVAFLFFKLGRFSIEKFFKDLQMLN